MTRQPFGQQLRGPDRDGGLADDQARPVQQRSERAQAAMHLGQVGAVGARPLRRADADEVQVAEGGQPPRRTW